MQLSLPTKRLLVADDYPDVAELLMELISATAPFPIEGAFVLNGAEALAKVLADRPDCVILDIDMPVMDGVSAAIAMRSALGAQTPVLIAMTGNPRQSYHIGNAAIFDHHFVKPTDVDHFISLIRAAPSRH